MRYYAVIFLILVGCKQTEPSDQLEKQRLEIEHQVETNLSKLVVLVRVAGENDLRIVLNQDWPEEIETTFNIFKNQEGQIIYLGEFPTSESGDWDLELKHYFDTDGRLIAFEKRLSYFNDECTDGAVVDNLVELYDVDFSIIKTTKTLTDNKGKELDEKDCGGGHNRIFEKHSTLSELTRSLGIDIGMLNQPETSVDNAVARVSGDQEDFKEFFEKFKNDSLFQIERVKFPFRVHDYDGKLVSERNKSDWKESSFYYHEASATLQMNAYMQEVKTYGDTVKLEYRGIDNGIWMDYEFVSENGKWILVSGKDDSD